MRDIIKFNDINVDFDSIVKSQKLDQNSKNYSKFKSIFNQAVQIFNQKISPQGILRDITIDEFEFVYKNSANEENTPVRDIYKKADSLALFAVTLGQDISKEIEDLFNNNDYAVAYTVDLIASQGADNLAELIEKKYLNNLIKLSKKSVFVMRYSPGYCGWDISSQKNLFQILNPQEIGIKLNDSYLMYPLKSVTGVLIAGEKKIHQIKSVYPACKNCSSKTCIDRIKLI